MGRAALAAAGKLEQGDADGAFYQAKIATARFFAEHYLTQAEGLKISIVSGSIGTLALTADQF
jgi:butyryl-CoA dehydrogenase